MAKKNQSQDAAMPPPESFEKAMRELEELVTRMDEPGIGLDGLLSDYKRGAELVKYCRNRLEAVRVEMQKIGDQLQQPEGDS